MKSLIKGYGREKRVEVHWSRYATGTQMVMRLSVLCTDRARPPPSGRFLVLNPARG
jgi:hypothetical protein